MSVGNGVIGGNIERMFSNENVFRLIYFPISPAAAEGTCSGLWCSAWYIPGSLMSVLVTLSLDRNLSFSWHCSNTLASDE